MSQRGRLYDEGGKYRILRDAAVPDVGVQLASLRWESGAEGVRGSRSMKVLM